MNKEVEGFTKKYNCTDLVYYEKFDRANTAISREKQIKKYRREKKNELIEKENPDYKSLNDRILKVDDEHL
jgi:putative endonuclease